MIVYTSDLRIIGLSLLIVLAIWLLLSWLIKITDPTHPRNRRLKPPSRPEDFDTIVVPQRTYQLMMDIADQHGLTVEQMYGPVVVSQELPT